MFMIQMPADFAIGQTRDCRINRKPERLTWRDKSTLVIEPGDARKIVSVTRRDPGNVWAFVCADADGGTDFSVFGPEGRIY